LAPKTELDHTPLLSHTENDSYQPLSSLFF
jgi:hypothetical protein